jgi:hypothetical protein
MAENYYCPPASTLSCTATNSTTTAPTAVIAASAFQTIAHNLTSADLERYYKANPEVASSIPEIISTAENEIKKHMNLRRKPRVTVYLSPDSDRLNIVFRLCRNSVSYRRLLKIWDKVCKAVYSKAKEAAKKISIILTI